MVLIAQEFHEHFWQILRTATKFDKIFHFKFDVTEQCQIFSGRFFQILWLSQNIPTLINIKYTQIGIVIK